MKGFLSKCHCIESRSVTTGPWYMLFASVYVWTFQPGNLTGWGSEGANKITELFAFYCPQYTNNITELFALYCPQYTNNITELFALYCPQYTNNITELFALYCPQYTNNITELFALYCPQYTNIRTGSPCTFRNSIRNIVTFVTAES